MGSIPTPSPVPPSSKGPLTSAQLEALMGLPPDPGPVNPDEQNEAPELAKSIYRENQLSEGAIVAGRLNGSPTITSQSSSPKLNVGELGYLFQVFLNYTLPSIPPTCQKPSGVHAVRTSTSSGSFSLTRQNTSEYSEESIFRGKPPITEEEYKNAWNLINEAMTLAYSNVLTILKECRGKGLRNTAIKLTEITDQRNMIEITIRSLTKYPLGTASISPMYDFHFPELRKSLDTIHRVLQAFQSTLMSLAPKLPITEDTDESDKEAFVILLKDFESQFSESVTKCEYFKSSAYQALLDIGFLMSARPQSGDDKQNLEKLFRQCQATTTLYQCLCRACPKECLETHTVYLRLEPERPDEGLMLPKLAVDEPASNVNVTWRCHMAFKSAITESSQLIWLRVVSSCLETEESGLSQQIAESNSENLHLDQPAHVPKQANKNIGNTDSSSTLSFPSAWPELLYLLRSLFYVVRWPFWALASLIYLGMVLMVDHVERKRESAKAPTSPYHHSRSSSASLNSRRVIFRSEHREQLEIHTSHSTIEVCPGFLTAQHHTKAHPVMRMMDATGYDHWLSYLSPVERPESITHGEPRSLGKVLKDRRKKSQMPDPSDAWQLNQSVKYPDYSYRWRTHNARLIAEAVLRFELVEMDAWISLRNHIVYYRTSRGMLEPFLTVKIPKPSPATPRAPASPADKSHGRVSVSLMRPLLIDLGMVLLCLGLPSEDTPEEGLLWSAERDCPRIRESANLTQLGQKYVHAVLCCADFFKEEDGDSCPTEVFRERYFQKIVQPLQDAESSFRNVSGDGSY